MIIRGEELKGPLRETAEICIIGSGCGGGATAKCLAESGRRVVVIEEGGYYEPTDFDGTEEYAYQHLYQQRAGQATDDLAVTVLQGRCVGGSSTVNWTTSLRTPDFVLDAWRKDYGVTGFSPADLDPYFARVEGYLNIHSEPAENHSPNNRIILDGARKLGYRAKANGRNTKGCVKAGACGLGCPFDAKLSVDRTYIRDAVQAGATLYSRCRAEKIETDGGVKRISGVVLDPATNRRRTDFVIEAAVVVVAASAIQSPVLLLKSGVGNSHGQLGQNLTFHITSAVLGVFEQTIYAGGGIPQSALCDEYLNRNGDGGGFWIEAVPVYPTLAGLALPGFGKEHRDLMRQYRNIGASIVLVKEIDSHGTVSLNEQARASVTYTLGTKDLQYLKQGLQVAAEIHFAAGARRVMTLHSKMTDIRRPEEIALKLGAAEWGPNQLSLFSAHPLGTCRMGNDPRRSVVDSHCQVHNVPGLFVIDGSVMPSSLGVNPQVTILAIAEKTAEWLADNYTGLVRR
jgi:choline dehydrogenase-like flavoprotein